jgi:hypothetical protein
LLLLLLPLQKGQLLIDKSLFLDFLFWAFSELRPFVTRCGR